MKCLNSMATVVFLIAASLGVGPSAEAAVHKKAEGCNSQVILKGDTWGMDTYYQVPDTKLIDLRDIRLASTAGYLFCPNGDNPDKVKVQWLDYCWAHTGKRSWVFDGVKFNAFIGNNYSSVDPPQVKVPDNQTIQGCVHQDIASADERWMRIDENAGWMITAEIVRLLHPDVERRFKTTGGSQFKLFVPANDANLSGWYY